MGLKHQIGQELPLYADVCMPTFALYRASGARQEKRRKIGKVPGGCESEIAIAGQKVAQLCKGGFWLGNLAGLMVPAKERV